MLLTRLITISALSWEDRRCGSSIEININKKESQVWKLMDSIGKKYSRKY